MKPAYSATVGEIRSEINAGNWSNAVLKIGLGFLQTYKQPASEEEKKSWRNSIPALIRALPVSCDELPILLEFKMPLGSERADAILLGGAGAKRAIVFELKQWDAPIRACTYSPASVIVDAEKGIARPHPSYQVEGYVGKLLNYHSVAKDYEARGIVYLHNLKKSSDFQAETKGFASQVFTKENAEQLSRCVEEFLLPNHKTHAQAVEFAAGEYIVSGRLVDFIKKNAEGIKNRIYSELAATGFSLGAEQLEVVREVLSAANEAAKDRKNDRAPARRTFVIHGPPGSGKTLVALTLLVECLGLGLNAIYGLRRNAALINTLRHALSRDLSGSIYFLNIPRTQMGIADKGFHAKGLDLIICDEAQRMLRDSIRVIHTRAPVCVFFVDEAQRLNIDEAGTDENFKHGSGKTGARFKILPELPTGVRCRGGVEYHNFAETLLQKPLSLKKGFLSKPPWGRSYDFRIFDDYRDFIKALEHARDHEQRRVALVCSWTESQGDITWKLSHRPQTTRKNLRIAQALQSGGKLYPQGTRPVSWAMNPEDYRSFWSGASSYLDICASIYGSQGFESDVIGFVWGRDLIWTGNAWAPGARNSCWDDSGGSGKSLKSLIDLSNGDLTHPACEQARTLLLNRARVFLTRGIMGTFVYAEDENTRKFLKSLAVANLAG